MEDVDILTKHGLGVMKNVDAMVNCIKADDDDGLVKKIHQVSFYFRKKNPGLNYDLFFLDYAESPPKGDFFSWRI